MPRKVKIDVVKEMNKLVKIQTKRVQKTIRLQLPSKLIVMEEKLLKRLCRDLKMLKVRYGQLDSTR